VVLTIIKYNAGNIQSVLYALERIGVSATVTDDHEHIRNADKVIFPGVGEASSAMRYLKERGLDEVLVNLKQPVLGICLGMQLMCSYSEENDTQCLGIFDEKVKKFISNGRDYKIPQIGWNNIYDLKTPLFNGLNERSYCYFVHGYYAALGNHSIATTNYILPIVLACIRIIFTGYNFTRRKARMPENRY